jgi:hypothetical protein
MKSALLSLVAGALFILWVTEKCKPDPRPAIPQAVRDSMEALKVRTAEDADAVAARDSINAELQILAQDAIDRARSLEMSATRLRVRGDSLRGALSEAATAADSVPVLVVALETSEARASALDMALAEERTARASAEQQALVWRAADSTSRARVAEWQASHSVLEGVVRRLEDRLRPRFPSTIESFLVGVVTGGAIIVGVANAG